MWQPITDEMYAPCPDCGTHENVNQRGGLRCDAEHNGSGHSRRCWQRHFENDGPTICRTCARTADYEDRWTATGYTRCRKNEEWTTFGLCDSCAARHMFMLGQRDAEEFKQGPKTKFDRWKEGHVKV